MAKRFIDTEIFDDEWFMGLSKDEKITHIYLFAKCNHAGIIKLNIKLAEFQTGVKGLTNCIKKFGNRCVKIQENVYFLPKFIKFQYPNFPNSKVKQQKSALDILSFYGIDFKGLVNSIATVSEGLDNHYEHENDNDNDTVNEHENEPENEPEKPKKKLTDLDLTFNNFKEMRIKARKPMTENAENLLKKKLRGMTNDPNVAIQILEQSIINCYAGIFPLKSQDVIHPKVGSIKNKPSLDKIPDEEMAGPEEVKKFMNSDIIKSIAKKVE